MGHEAILYGCIEGIAWRRDQYRLLQDRNAAVLLSLPTDDVWPWLVRGMFALPASGPQGTYRQQVIHFGASLADDPFDPALWDGWLAKFEGLLRQLYWLSAVVHLETESDPPRAWRWRPTDAALARLGTEDPAPFDDWTRDGPSSARGGTLPP